MRSPLTLRTKLTLFYSITVSVLLTGFAFVYFRVLNVGLDRDLTQEVIDRCFQGVTPADREKVLWRTAAGLYRL